MAANLDPLAAKINSYLTKKFNKRSIAKLHDVLPNMLYAWVEGAEAGVIRVIS